MYKQSIKQTLLYINSIKKITTNKKLMSNRKKSVADFSNVFQVPPKVLSTEIMKLT